MHLHLAAKLAWSNTTDNWPRLAVRCSGITFAVVLMFMQNGFSDALFDSNVRIIEEKIDADIVIYTKSRFMLSSGQTMPLERVVAARNCPGVASAEPFYIENMTSELRPGKNLQNIVKSFWPSRRIRVISFDIRSDSFAGFGLQDYAEQLDMPLTGAADVKSKNMFMFPSDDSISNQAFGELAGKQIRLVGTFELGMDFSNDGNLIVSPRNFVRFFSMRGNGDPLSLVDYCIVNCDPDADPKEVVKELEKNLGESVKVKSKKDFLQLERKFWRKSTPVGLIFAFGKWIGFLVGVIICYQVLATDIGDNMGEFATIKAMGYPPSFFGAVVVIQALLLSVASFIPGVAISALTFEAINSFAKLGMSLFGVWRIGTVFLLTVAMCVISGLSALRKLLSADPASLF